MDEFNWIWMYYNWLQDKEELHKTYKDYALFIGSFSNWEMANNIHNKENPKYQSSDEDFDRATEMVVKEIEEEESKSQNRHRRVIR